MKFFLSLLILLALSLPAQAQLKSAVCVKPHMIRDKIEKETAVENPLIYYLAYDLKRNVVKRKGKIYPSNTAALVVLARYKASVFFFNEKGCMFSELGVDPAWASEYFLDEILDYSFPLPTRNSVYHDPHH